MSLTVTLCSAIDSGGAAVLVLRKLWQKAFLFDFFGKFKASFRHTVSFRCTTDLPRETKTDLSG